MGLITRVAIAYSGYLLAPARVSKYDIRGKKARHQTVLQVTNFLMFEPISGPI